MLVFTDFKISKKTLVLSQLVTSQGSLQRPPLPISLLNASKTFYILRPSRRWFQKISGVKESISTSSTLSWYFLFFSLIRFLKIAAVGFPWLVLELTCVTLTSKNAVPPRDQKPPALTSSVQWLEMRLHVDVLAHFVE